MYFFNNEITLLDSKNINMDEDLLKILIKAREKTQSEMTESGRAYVRQLQKRFIMEDLRRKRIELISKIYDKKR